MKTKRIAAVALFVMGLLFITPSAQAFYNPSTGRWLSRDPIEEKGGLNIQAFVKNDVGNKIDRLGLDSCGSCGPSVTRQLQRTLQDVQVRFNSWSREEKLTSCNRIQGFVGLSRHPIPFPQRALNAADAWDILDLAYLTEKFPNEHPFERLGSPGNCRYTVGFQGGCYYAAQVNYAFFGKAFRLCNDEFARDPDVTLRNEWALEKARVYVTLWKFYIHRKNGEFLHGDIQRKVSQAFAFTNYGFDAARIPGKSVSCTECEFQSKDAVDFWLDWTWLPYVKRSREPNP